VILSSEEVALGCDLGLQIQQEGVVKGHVVTIAAEDQQVSPCVHDACMAVTSSWPPTTDLAVEVGLLLVWLRVP